MSESRGALPAAERQDLARRVLHGIEDYLAVRFAYEKSEHVDYAQVVEARENAIDKLVALRVVSRVTEPRQGDSFQVQPHAAPLGEGERTE